MDLENLIKDSELASLRRQVAKLKLENLELRKLAFYDSLTGVFNRTLTIKVLKRMLRNAHKRNEVVVYVLVDADKLKSLNDELGHEIGDIALVCIANSLVDYFRDGDHILRYGGDEFVIMLVLPPQCVESTLGSIPNSFTICGGVKAKNAEITFSVSIGYAYCDPLNKTLTHGSWDHKDKRHKTSTTEIIGSIEDDPQSVQHMLQFAADSAMYVQKGDRRKA